MSWLGIGHIAGHWTPFSANLPLLSPSALWTGVEGSGFSALPQDPVRSTAKPALRLLTPPFQWFTDTIDIGVMAAANEGGTLRENLGIADITFHFEGTSLVVDKPSWHTIATRRGPRTYFGWWVRLKKPAARQGTGHLYAEARARDVSMQKRVIGPFVFCPQTSQYDAQIEVAASLPPITGKRYQSIPAAAAYAKSVGAVNPLLTIIEPGLYTELGEDASPTRWNDPGYLNLTARVPGAVIGRAGYTNDAGGVLRTPRMKLHAMGPNLAFDWRYVTYLNNASLDGIEHWLDGVTIFNSSPHGRFELWRGGPKPASSGAIIGGNPWLTEVTIRDVDTPATRATLVRGCDIKDIRQDIVSGGRLVVGNIIRDHDSDFWNLSIPAISVRYTGAASIATLARSGGTEGNNGGVYTLQIGTSIYTFDVGIGSEAHLNRTLGDGYWFADVANWLNSFPDITATLLISPDRRACTGSLAGLKGQGFPATDIKAAALQLVSHTDKHGDFYQHGSGVSENCIIAFNRAWNIKGQLVILSPILSDGLAETRDVIFLANAFHHRDGSHISQIGRPSHKIRHVVFAHNTFTNQRLSLRTQNEGFEGDSYCLFKNNTMVSFGYSAAPLANVVVDGLHLHSGSVPPPNAQRVAVGGTDTALFPNAASGDFTPAGALLASGFPAGLMVDFNRTAYPQIAAPGAVAAPATPFVPPPPSANPEADLIAILSASGGLSAIHHYDEATLSAGLWLSLDKTGLGNHHRQTTSAQQPPLSTTGAVFASNDAVVQDGTANGATISVIMSFTKDDASTIGNLMSTAEGYVPVSYASGNTAGHGLPVRVNGQVTNRRDVLYTALHQTGERIVTIESLKPNGPLRIGRHTSALVGKVRRVIVLDHTALGDNIAAAIIMAEQVAALS